METATVPVPEVPIEDDPPPPPPPPQLTRKTVAKPMSSSSTKSTVSALCRIFALLFNKILNNY
jgi:hypothetical protein